MSTYSNLLFHIVFSSKYRRNLIDDTIQTRLYEYTGGIICEQKGLLLEIGGMLDHVHLLAKLNPSIAILDVLRATKASSSKWVSDTFSTKKDLAWQSGFGAFSVSSSNVDQVRGLHSEPKTTPHDEIVPGRVPKFARQTRNRI